MRIQRFPNAIIGVVLLSGLLVTGCRAPQAPFLALRASFRPIYNLERSRLEESLSPIVVVRFSDVFLVKEGKIHLEAKGIPKKYHLLHGSAHVPLVVYLKLQNHFGTVLDRNAAADLRAYRSLVQDARTDLGHHGFTDEEFTLQDALLADSDNFLATLKEGLEPSEESYTAYRDRVVTPMMTLAARAGAVQVEALHSVMLKWRTALTDDEWSRLRVIIVGPRQPRMDYAATQYFATLFPARGNTPFRSENERVYYIEDPVIDRDDRSFVDIRRTVASIILDAQASKAIFADADRMSIDIVAEGARMSIATLNLDSLR